ncbi:hypothetical protein DESUT3_30560 [Desulfuromonas versatilis]|uniref:Type II secretion system protein K n=1 Tax=Desulfuromonas versatilis TaxID=2802975 RepID=A0ABM8HZF9_9BACT|nr:type II secretion system minor pseudopilin GspK [Desulfuromonas versatilis]BCR05987.1 hypothetical protein DESUT3_30560 [Desulfuromonas versatilis]
MKSLRQEKGMVLLLVLVVVALLASLLTELAFSTLVDLRLTETFRDSTRAYYLAKGGVRVGRIILQEDSNEYDARNDPSELWSLGLANYPVGDGVVSVTVEDQGGKLDVNRLVRDVQGQPRVNVDPDFKGYFYRFFRDVLGLANGEELTAALIDWIDEDDTPYVDPDTGATLGTESDYYLRLDKPYPCKNGPFDTLEELALVRGFTPEVMKLIRDHVTVHGSGKININTATAEVLMSLSDDPVIDRAAAEDIIAIREREPYKSAADLQTVNNLPGMSNLDRRHFVLKSETFHIWARGEVGDGAREVEAFVLKAGDKLLYFKVN